MSIALHHTNDDNYTPVRYAIRKQSAKRFPSAVSPFALHADDLGGLWDGTNLYCASIG